MIIGHKQLTTSCRNHGPYYVEDGCRKCIEEKLRYKNPDHEILKCFTAMGITPRTTHCLFENYVAEDLQQRKAKSICESWSLRFRERLKDGFGMILMGRVGTGKTHLATAILKFARFNYGANCKMIKPYHLYKEKIDKTFDPSRYAKFDLLIIDEVGHSEHPGSRESVIDVIYERYEAIKPTIITTNLSLPELGLHLGDRVVDRLTAGGECSVYFGWESYRPKIKCYEQSANILQYQA